MKKFTIFAPSFQRATMHNIQALKAFLDTPRKAVILTHFKPDADALGSSLGLCGYLKKKGHTVKVITPSDYPNFLSWMPGNNEVLVFQKDKPDQSLQWVAGADIIFCLDFNSLNRIN